MHHTPSPSTCHGDGRPIVHVEPPTTITMSSYCLSKSGYSGSERLTDAALWEFAKHHPLAAGAVNVDRISGVPHSPVYNDIRGKYGLYVDRVNDNWNNRNGGKGKKGGKARRAIPKSDEDEQEISITFSNIADGSTKEFQIKPSTCLRTLFNDYADECDKPIRSLRFAMNGSTLFLSSLGKKTAKDLNLIHLDCISVSNLQEITSSPLPEDEASKKAQSKKTKKGSGKKQNKKGKGRKQPQSMTTYDIEDNAKVAHSLNLSELFQEAEPIFKAIRQKLNNLTLEKKSPKMRRMCRQLH